MLKKRHSPQQIAKKYDKDLQQVIKRLKAGAKIQKQHTTSEKDAQIIASHHIWQRWDYYPKLLTYVQGKKMIKQVLKQMFIKQQVSYIDMKNWFDPNFACWLKAHPSGTIQQYQKDQTPQEQKYSQVMNRQKTRQRRQLQKSDNDFYKSIWKKLRLKNMDQGTMKNQITKMVQDFQRGVSGIAGQNGPVTKLTQKPVMRQGCQSGQFTPVVSNSDGSPITGRKGKMQQDVNIIFAGQDDSYVPLLPQEQRQLLPQFLPGADQRAYDHSTDQIFQASSKCFPSQNQLNGQVNSPLRNASRPSQQRQAHSNRIDFAINWVTPQTQGTKVRGQKLFQGADNQEYYDLMQSYMVQVEKEKSDLTPRSQPGIDPGYDVR